MIGLNLKNIPVALLAVVSLICVYFPASANLPLETHQGSNKDSRVLTIVSDTETEKPICAVVYDKSAIKSTDLPECEGENLALAEAVKPQGVDMVAMNSYTQTAMVSCIAGHVIEARGLNDDYLGDFWRLTIDVDGISMKRSRLLRSDIIGGSIGENFDKYSNGKTHSLVGQIMATECATILKKVTTIFRSFR